MVGRRGALLAVSTLLLVSSCRRGVEEKQKQAAEATQRAEEKARESTLTSGTLEKKDAAAAEAREAEDDALRSRAEALVELRREQLDYRGRLQHAIDELDLELARVRGARIDAGRLAAPPEPATADMVRRRDELARDVAAIDRSTEQDWPALRSRIDRELAREGQR